MPSFAGPTCSASGGMTYQRALRFRPRANDAFSEHLAHGCPAHPVPLVVQPVELPFATEHVAQVLHPLPDRESSLARRPNGARDAGQTIESTEGSAAHQLELLARELAGDAGQVASAPLVACDAQDPWRGII